jgi:hypothetical protein
MSLVPASTKTAGQGPPQAPASTRSRALCADTALPKPPAHCRAQHSRYCPHSRENPRSPAAKWTGRPPARIRAPASLTGRWLAHHALALLARLVRYGEINYHGGFVNLVTGATSVLRVDPQCWKRTRTLNMRTSQSR